MNLIILFWLIGYMIAGFFTNSIDFLSFDIKLTISYFMSGVFISYGAWLDIKINDRK